MAKNFTNAQSGFKKYATLYPLKSGCFMIAKCLTSVVLVKLFAMHIPAALNGRSHF
ncbi:MAG: hypothetical protein HY099_00390 [Nitrospirae bacterium]|nr:hypothetical protein [Nitrospirota bacterium]